tara:strand:+ start:2438 stop:3889 length:1452 start_codon:yes stop_codon:yes gene_type:complete
MPLIEVIFNSLVLDHSNGFGYRESDMRKFPPWVQILTALALGAIFGGFINYLSTTAASDPDSAGVRFSQTYIGIADYVGGLFMSALKMIIVPLIFSSVVVGIAGVGNQKGFGRRGLKTLLYYVSTSFFAILIGLTFVNLVKPGFVDGKPNPEIREMIEGSADSLEERVAAKVAGQDRESLNSVWDIFARMVPSNITEVFADNGRMLALIFVSLLVGFGILHVSEAARTSLLGVFKSVNELMVLLTGWIMVLAPIGVFALVTETFATSGFEIIGLVAKYFVVVLLALATHMFVILPLILKYVAKVSPLKHFMAMRNALLTAFSTSSSSATLPITIRAVRENVGVSDRTASFVLPLGATVNMDGTALYECVAVIFVAQVMGAQLAVSQQLTVVLLALLTSIGVAGVPSASLVAIVIIVHNVLVPIIGASADAVIGLLLAVDRLLDMSRTAVNVFSDSCGALVVAKLEGETGLLEDPMHTAHANPN